MTSAELEYIRIHVEMLFTDDMYLKANRLYVAWFNLNSVEREQMRLIAFELLQLEVLVRY